MAYAVAYLSGSAADVLVSPSSGVVVMAAEQTQASITVAVLDDTLPEQEELLAVSLVAVSGDAVLVAPDMATLVIASSDYPNGVFAFAEDSQLVAAEEGDMTQLM